LKKDFDLKSEEFVMSSNESAVSLVVVEGEVLEDGEGPVQSEATEATVTWVTPYQAAKLVNVLLEADGFAKILPAQMFYNYTKGQTKKEKKPMIDYDLETGKISTEVLQAWYIKYTTKLAGK
jgi:hypothetical protein